jgi:hypothetical protein
MKVDTEGQTEGDLPHQSEGSKLKDLIVKRDYKKGSMDQVTEIPEENMSKVIESMTDLSKIVTTLTDLTNHKIAELT